MKQKTERFTHALANTIRAHEALQTSVTTPVTEPRDLSGIIKDFEILYELSWKVLQQHLANEGHPTNTAREAIQTAYQRRLIDDEETWLQILKDQNLTVHTYNQDFAKERAGRIRTRYVKAFGKLLEYLQK